ncbi:MAG: hypothetical protein HZA89_00295 [Verrucomicrobia bacterium]|nr:hypothetical protein [Verrucomicrobiota bacterium]
MNATVIETLRAESVRLKRRAKRIDDLIAEFDSEPAPTESVSPIPLPPPSVPAVHPLGSLDLIGQRQPDACFQILKEAGNPLSREEIFTRARARGVKIPTVDHLSPVLSRDKRFKSAGRGMWKLADE